MRALIFIKQLPVPAILGAGIYAGSTGSLPLIGDALDGLLADFDLAVFEGVKHPATFMLFLGLAMAWLIYIAFWVGVWSRKERALVELGDLRERGTHRRNDFKSVDPSDAERQEFRDMETKIYRYAERVSKSEVGLLRTIDTFDRTLLPSFTYRDPQLLHFSERLRRLSHFINKHSRPS